MSIKTTMTICRPDGTEIPLAVFFSPESETDDPKFEELISPVKLTEQEYRDSIVYGKTLARKLLSAGK